ADMSDILREMRPKIGERAPEAVGERCPGLPARERAKARIVGVVVADIDALPLRGEGARLVAAAATVGGDERLRERFERGVLTADVEDAALGLGHGAGEEKSVGGVVDIGEVALLR